MAASRHNLVRLRRTATLVQTDGTLVEGDELVHWSLAIHPHASGAVSAHAVFSKQKNKNKSLPIRLRNALVLKNA